MKNKILLLLCFALCYALCLPVFSQVNIVSMSSADDQTLSPVKKTILDNCVVKVQYRMEYIKNTNNPNKKNNNFMLLQIGEKTSKFSDYFRLKTDSMYDDFVNKKMEFSEASSKIMPIFTGTLALNVFKNYPTGKMTVIDRAFLAGTFKYTEDMVKMKWKLLQGKATICGYQCQQATTTFRGREYTAWYTPKIAYSDGPWKFNGLPGLILLVTDSKNEYKFECVAIEKAGDNEKIYIIDNDLFTTTRERFNITAKNATDNPNPYAESVGAKAIPNRKIPYNPIELE